MYNNFSSKKTKKVISALLASALVVTSAPITADAATTKVLGVKKTFTVKKTTKVSGLSKAEKKIVKVSVNKKKRKVTVKGVKPGKATFKIGSKTYNVKVGSTSVAVKAGKKTMTVGQYTNVKATGKNGAKDTIVFTSSNSKVVAVNSAKKATKTANSKGVASVKATAKKAGTVTITAASKYTGKKVKIKLTVKAATTTTATPEVTATATATGGAATATPEVTATATATATATTNPTATGNAATATPEVPSGSATTAPTEVPSGSATTAPTVDPSATAVPTVDPSATVAPTQTPEVVSPSVVSVGAVDSQGNKIELSAVTKNATLEVTFNTAIDASSVNNGTLTLTDANGKNVSIPASDVALSPSGKKATVDLGNAGLEKLATYTLTVNGVKSYQGDDVVPATTTFQVANYAVVKNIRLDGQSETDELDTNMETRYTDNTFSSTTVGKRVVVEYDELLDKTTVNAANVTLVNKTTGERVACDIGYDNGKICLDSKTSLISKNLYVLTITGVKTSVNGVAEDMTHIFTVNGETPLTGTVIVRTLDNAVITTTAGDKIWPKLTAGLKDKISDNGRPDLTDSTYHAGLQINISVQENLDAASVAENVLLVEKESKDVVPATITWNAEAKLITIIPNADLKEDTDYQIQYLGGLMTTDYVYLNASKKTDVIVNNNADREFKTYDATAPEVVSIVSEKGTKGLEARKDQTFIVTFSEPVANLSSHNILVVASSVDLSDSQNSGSTDMVNVNTPIAVAGTNNTQYKVTIPEGTEGDYQLKADKAYKFYVVGKDMLNNDALGMQKDNTGTKKVPCDPAQNYLKKSGVYAFSTENDTTAPQLLGVYDGNPYDGGKNITTETVTNINGQNNEFWFVYDEEIVLADSRKITVEKETAGVWSTANDASIDWETASDADVSGLVARTGESKKTMLKIVLDNVSSDANYRIAIEKGAIRDTANTDADKCNYTSLYRYGFIGSEGDDVAAKVNMFASIYDNMKNNNNTVDRDTADTKIKVESKFFVVLDEDKTTGITKDNFIVTDGNGNAVAGTVKEVSNFDTTKTVYSFTPAANLAYDTTYTVVLKGVKDIIGNTIVQKANDFKTVADNVKVASTSIENNAVSVDRQKEITFTLDQEKLLTKGDRVTLVEDGVGRDLSFYTLSTTDKKTYTIRFGGTDDDTKTAGVDEATRLKENTAYTLTIDPSTTANKKEIKFITGKTATDNTKPVSLGTIKSNNGTNPTIETIIRDGKTDVNLAKYIVLPYSEAIDVSSATVKVTLLNPGVDDATNVGVRPLEAVNYGTAVSAVGTEINDGLKVSFADALKTTKDYKIEVTGVKDKAGNAADDLEIYAMAASGTTNATVATTGINATGYTMYADQTASTPITASTKNYAGDTVYAKKGNDVLAVKILSASSAIITSSTNAEDNVKVNTAGTANEANSSSVVLSTNTLTFTRISELNAEVDASIEAFETHYKVGKGEQTAAIGTFTDTYNNVVITASDKVVADVTFTVAAGLTTGTTAGTGYYEVVYQKGLSKTVTKFYAVESTTTADKFTVTDVTDEVNEAQATLNAIEIGLPSLAAAYSTTVGITPYAVEGYVAASGTNTNDTGNTVLNTSSLALNVGGSATSTDHGTLNVVYTDNTTYGNIVKRTVSYTVTPIVGGGVVTGVTFAAQ